MGEAGSGGGRGSGCSSGCAVGPALAVLVLFGLYWVSPLHDPGNEGAARAGTVGPAQLLQDSLAIVFNSPNGGFGLGNEGTFDHEADRWGGSVLDVRSRVTDGRRDLEVDVLFVGSAMPKFGASRGEATLVHVCYRYSWQGHVYTIEHSTVVCPPGLPDEPVIDRVAVATASPPATVRGTMRDERALADRITEQMSAGGGDAYPTRRYVAALVRMAHISADIPRSIAVRQEIGLIALGTRHACVFGALDSHSMHTWVAPWQAPCTTERAFQGYGLTKWPPMEAS